MGIDLSMFKKEEERLTFNGESGDSEYFMPEMKNGKVSFVIRILPAVIDGKANPTKAFYVEWRKHKFTVGQKGFARFCPRTFGKQCYICDESTTIFDMSKSLHYLVKARISFVFAVEIIQFKDDPSLEGQRKFWFASKNFFVDSILPQLTDEVEPNPFHDLKEGCNVGITIENTDKGRKYTARFYKPTEHKIKAEEIPNLSEFMAGKLEGVEKKFPKSLDNDIFKKDYLAMFPQAPVKRKLSEPVVDNTPVVNEPPVVSEPTNDIANEILDGLN